MSGGGRGRKRAFIIFFFKIYLLSESEGRSCEMSTTFMDTLLIFSPLCARLFSLRALTCVLVYRTDKYKRLKAEVEKQREEDGNDDRVSWLTTKKKKTERQEKKRKINKRSIARMKSMFAMGFCFPALMGTFNSIFSGRVVAKLSDPFSFTQGRPHRHLLGGDTMFLSVLCSVPVQQTIHKILELAPSQAPATSRQVDFLALHLLLGSSPEVKQNPLIPVVFRYARQTGICR